MCATMKRMSRPTFHRSRALLAVCSCLAFSACGSLGEPYLGSFPTSSVPPQEAGQTDDAGLQGNPAGPVGDISGEALPPRPADYIPSIVVLSDSGVGVIERISGGGPDRFSELRPVFLSDGSQDEDDLPTTTVPEDGEVSPPSTVIDSRIWTRVSDDLFGGLVLQAASGEVMWFPGTGGEARQVSVEGEFLEVGYSGGTPEALTVQPGQVSRTRLIDNDSTPFAEIDNGEEVIDLSSSGGIVAVVKSDQACGSVAFLAGDGTPLALDPIAEPDCGLRSRPTVGSVALSPDGEAVAFTLIEYREDGVELVTNLTAIELTSGAEILSTEIGGSGDVVSSLAFDGSTAVALRRSSSLSEVVVVDADSIEVLDIGTESAARAVTFARLPLSENLG